MIIISSTKSNADMNIGVPKNCHLSSNNSDTKQKTMAQQTAVEWLVEQLKRQGFLYDLDIEAAKQKEKEQIINAASLVLWNNSSNSTEAAEQYYNKTYGQ